MSAPTLPALRAFLEGFVRPLVAGGPLHVGRPLPIAAVDDFEAVLDHAADLCDPIDDARTRVLGALVPHPPPMILGRDELALAMALHNALVLVHPDLDRIGVTKRQQRRLAAVAQALASQPLSREPRRVLARHALLHNVLRLTRTDLALSWWTGRATFAGQPAPARLLRWRGVRRVREDRRQVGADELLTGEDILPTIATLLRRSPLTLLLTDAAQSPTPHWEDAAFLLRDRALARAIAHAAFDGTTSAAQVLRPARWAAALEQMLERSPPPTDVRAVVALLVYVAGLACVLERRLAPDEPSPLLPAAGSRPRGLAAFWALPAAVAQVVPALAVPPGIAAEPDLAARWQAHRRQADAAVGAAQVETLVARLRRALLLGGAPVPPSDTPASVDAPAPEGGQAQVA